jgi:glycosyltransferase involved in cell wall biosynthesis
MKVLLCTDTLNDVNGVCRFIRNVAIHHHQRGRDLTVLTSTRLAHPIGETLPPNVINLKPLWARPMPGYPLLELAMPPVWQVVDFARRWRPDVIHISTPGPVGWAGLLASRVVRCPAVGVYHTDFPAYVERLFEDEGLTAMARMAMRVFYRRFAAVLCRSEEYRESLLQMGVCTARVQALRPGVDVSAFGPRYRDVGVWAGFGLRPRSFKVLNVGRLSVEKNLPFLIQVWKDVRQRLILRGIDAELVVIGDGPYRSRMEAELRGMDAHFLGFRFGEELSRLYASSDLFVFPSVTDTLGQVAMESQASGLPVLVSDAGGPQAVVRHGVTGLVLPGSDAAAWAGAIEGLCIDDARRRAMGAAGHHAMQTMTIEDSLEDFWSVHEGVC